MSRRARYCSVLQSIIYACLKITAEKELSKTPRWEAGARLNQVPLAALVEVARHMGAPFPETLAAVRHRLNEDVQKGRLKAYIVLDNRTLETGVADVQATFAGPY